MFPLRDVLIDNRVGATFGAITGSGQVDGVGYVVDIGER
jgi:hypothetical protein